MKFGARIFKTGLAIMLALFMTPLLGLDAPVFAGIAATFAIQPSIYRTYHTLIDQIQANMIGAVIAVIFALAFGNDPFIVGMAAIIVIAINVKLKSEATISIALVTLVAIMGSPSESFIEYGLVRFASILVGIMSSFVINLVFIPPKYENKLYYRIADNTENIIKWIRMVTRQAAEHTALKTDLELLKDNMIKMNHFYLLYKEERHYLKKYQFAKTRKVVLFRQMLKTTNKALEILKRLHRHENEYFHLPADVQQLIQEELDCLLYYHEQTLMKFIGKTRTDLVTHSESPTCISQDRLMEQFMATYSEIHAINQKEALHLFQMVSAIVEYAEQLDHLNKLIDSFQTYHKEANEVSITEKSEI